MERIAVTGIGVVSPLGCKREILWNNLLQGKSGIETIESLQDLPVSFGGPAKDFDPTAYVSSKELRHLDRFSQMALVSGLDAVSQAGIDSATYPEERIGVLMGSGAGGIATLEQQIKIFNERGPRRISPLTAPMFILNIASGVLAMRIQAKGPGMGIASACATGGHALAVACRLIQAGDADCMVAGGVEACLTPFAVSAFAAMRALSTRNEEPEKASRPFDRDRDGFVMAEGGAALVLERYSAAKDRGAVILAEICGVGMSQDAYHMVAPDPQGTAVAYAMQSALADAGLAPHQIGYINAHGTSTPLNDPVETRAIKKVFGHHAYELYVSSTKSMTGHLIGGASSLETAICILAINSSMLPATINYENADPECDLKYIPNTAINAEVNYCLNNSFGFGGQNLALVIGKGE